MCSKNKKSVIHRNNGTVHNFTKHGRYEKLFASEITQSSLTNRFATEKFSLATFVIELSYCAAISVLQRTTVFVNTGSLLYLDNRSFENELESR